MGVTKTIYHVWLLLITKQMYTYTAIMRKDLCQRNTVMQDIVGTHTVDITTPYQCRKLGTMINVQEHY